MTLTPQVLTDARIYFKTADLTGWSNKVETEASVGDLDLTTFGSNGWNERTGGLFDTKASLEGFFEAGDLTKPDDTFWAQVGTGGTALTVVPTSGATGSLAYLTKVLNTDYKPGGQVGKLLAWSATCQGQAPLVRGQIMHPQGTARTTTGTGTGYQLGALTAAQRMYANLHVLSVAGTGTPSIAVTLQSSVDNTFASPTTRITFATDTDLDGQAMSVLGAVTDTWWRVAWTITGSSPSFLFAVAAGIGPK